MASQSDLVSKILRITDKTSGRDRLCRQVKSALVNDDVLQVVNLFIYRLVQYGSKFVSWLLEHGSLSPELINRLRDLESFISTARKREYTPFSSWVHCLPIIALVLE